MKAEQELLKRKLQIKQELKYIQGMIEEHKIKFPTNEKGLRRWQGMEIAYKIALEFFEGAE